jgi:hypothetical protein
MKAIVWVIQQGNNAPMWVMKVPVSGMHPQGLTHTYDKHRALRFPSKEVTFNFMTMNNIQIGSDAWLPMEIEICGI